MKGSEEKRYFKVGFFVISAFVLLVILILIFAGGSWFSRSVDVETYFNESVQGLTVGSPVKYRGITIGKVKQITFTGDIYNLKPGSKDGRYIYVLFSISPKLAGFKGRVMHAHQFVKHQIADGLRVKMVLQDLTGNVYLELHFLEPGVSKTVLPISWDPKHIYIPSTISVLTRLTDSVQKIVNGLKDVNYKQLFSNLENLAKTTDGTMKNVNRIVSRSERSFVQTSKNMQTITNSLSDLSAQLAANPSSILFDKPQEVDPSKL